MTSLLEFKERLNNIYTKYGRYIRAALKLIIAFVIFTLINGNIGYDQRWDSFPIVLGVSAVCSVLPVAIIILLFVTFSCIHIYYISPMLSLIVLIILLILYLFVIRFMKHSGIVMTAVPVLYMLKIPFVVPILLGLIATPLAIIPVTCGTIIYFLFKVIKDATRVAGSSSVEDILGLYKFVIDNLLSNKEMILAIVVFAIVLLVTYLIRNLSVDHAFNIAVISASVVNILGFLLGDLILNISNHIAFIIIGSIVSGLIVYVVQFFRLTLDYSTVEFTQFEDDDYYYYVKAVPKVKIAVKEKNVKTINPNMNEDDETTEILENEEDEMN